jgi:hypothetical protein
VKRALLEADDLFVGARETGAPLTYWRKHKDLARVTPAEPASVLTDELVRQTAEAWQVTDHAGTIFAVRRYEAAEHPSYDVVDPDGEPLATFFCEGGVLHEHVLVRDSAAAPVAHMDTRRHVHEITELHGERLASCRRMFDPAGNDAHDEVWSVHIEKAGHVLDRRALVAAPLICHLIGHRKRHVDPDCMIAGGLTLAFPPAGLALFAVERAVDGVYWLRRKLD